MKLWFHRLIGSAIYGVLQVASGWEFMTNLPFGVVRYYGFDVKTNECIPPMYAAARNVLGKAFKKIRR